MRALIAVALISLTSQPAPQTLEVVASLSGYNLLSPTERCCGFEYSVLANRVTSLRVTSGPAASDRPVRGSLPAERLAAVAQVLERQDFFGLPSSVGASPVDGDLRVIRARLAQGRWHEVRIGEAAFGDAPTQVERRAVACWRAVRALVEISGANVQ